MLAGEPFDLLVNLTDMQQHEALNRRALEAGKHVWSEKPIGNTLAAGQELLRLARDRDRRLWGALITVQSSQFAFMAKQLAEGKLGRVAAARGDYGHEGPRMGRRSSTRNWAVRCRTSRFTISRRSRACSAR
jgi:predicted dehydrogenase